MYAWDIKPIPYRDQPIRLSRCHVEKTGRHRSNGTEWHNHQNNWRPIAKQISALPEELRPSSHDGKICGKRQHIIEKCAIKNSHKRRPSTDHYEQWSYNDLLSLPYRRGRPKPQLTSSTSPCSTANKLTRSKTDAVISIAVFAGYRLSETWIP